MKLPSIPPTAVRYVAVGGLVFRDGDVLKAVCHFRRESQSQLPTDVPAAAVLDYLGVDPERGIRRRLFPNATRQLQQTRILPARGLKKGKRARGIESQRGVGHKLGPLCVKGSRHQRGGRRDAGAQRGGGEIGDIVSQGRELEATAPSLKEGGPQPLLHQPPHISGHSQLPRSEGGTGPRLRRTQASASEREMRERENDAVAPDSHREIAHVPSGHSAVDRRFGGLPRKGWRARPHRGGGEVGDLERGCTEGGAQEEGKSPLQRTQPTRQGSGPAEFDGAREGSRRRGFLLAALNPRGSARA